MFLQTTDAYCNWVAVNVQLLHTQAYLPTRYKPPFFIDIYLDLISKSAWIFHESPSCLAQQENRLRRKKYVKIQLEASKRVLSIVLLIHHVVLSTNHHHCF